MGSGDWFKTIIGKKKVKLDNSKQSKGSLAVEKAAGSKSKKQSQKSTANGGQVTNKANGAVPKLSEDAAATKIQTAIRAYMARRSLRRMKGAIRFQKMTQAQSVKKQSTSTLAHLHSWSRIQSEITERRRCMVLEDRIKQKKLENQLKLEAKLHDVEVEWNSGADSMDEILARIHQREEAAVKRERSLAYAFTHQWKANSNQNQGPDASELGKANWGWSWKERWIAARPWESRVLSQSVSPKKGQSKPKSKTGKGSNLLSTQKSIPIKLPMQNGNTPVKPRRLSYPGAEKPKPAMQGSNIKQRETTPKKLELAS